MIRGRRKSQQKNVKDKVLVENQNKDIKQVVGSKGNGGKKATSKSVKKEMDSKDKGLDAKLPKQQTPEVTNDSIAKQQSFPEPPIKKMERSHSFFLTRKLSKIYNTLTGSKENLTKIPENESEEPVFKFSRSLSLATIPLRKSYRRIVRETKLEKLHEEHPEKPDEIKEDVPKSPEELSTNTDENLSPTRERSNSFLSHLKRTFSATGEKKKSLNPKWSASLANLQQIDMMVSYEDLSFINYDKFNTYEKNLVKPIEKNYLQRSTNNRMSMDERMLNKHFQNIATTTENAILDTPAATVNPVVRRRQNNQLEKVRKSAYLDTNIYSNFDQSRNVYRNSLDDAKLKFLNKVNRDSFRLSNNLERTAEDVLMLDSYLGGNTPDTVDSGSDRVPSVAKKVKSVDFAESVTETGKIERSYDRHHSLYLLDKKVAVDDKVSTMKLLPNLYSFNRVVLLEM